MSITPRFRELVRHFLMRFYDNDLLSPDHDQLPGLTSLLGLLAAPGIIIPLWLMIKFSGLGGAPIYIRDIYSLGERFLFVTLSLTSVGLVTVLAWDALFPDQRDYLVLCSLPLRLRTIFGAKICSLLLFVGFFMAAVTSLTPLLLPTIILGSAPLPAWVWFITCHLLIQTAACLFAFLLVVGVQGLFLNLLPYRLFHKISAWLQMACLIALLLQFLISAWAFSLLRYDQARNDWTVYASPPLWFLGLYQYALGWDKPVFRDLACIGLEALAGAAVLAVCSYALAYKRHVKRCLEAAGIEAGAPGPLRRMFSRLVMAAAVRRPLERAVFQFIAITVGRSRKHRLHISAYAGFGLAIVIALFGAALTTRNHAWLHRPSAVLAWIPFALLFVLLPGLCHTYAIPAELKANWVFRLAEPGDQERVLCGIRRATLVLGILPIYIGLLPVYIWLWGPLDAVVHTAVGMTVALILREVLLLRFHKIPFTCSYVPGRGNVKTLWALYVMFYATVVGTLGRLEMWILVRPWRLVFLLAALAVIFRVRARLARREMAPLVFEDEPDPVVRELGLAV